MSDAHIDAIPLRRRRDRVFVAALIARLAQSKQVTDDVLIDAAREAYGGDSMRSTAYALKKAQQKLNLSDVGRAIAEYYDVATGFSLADALRLHVAHMQGIEYERIEIDEHGNEVRRRFKDKPNYQALKDFVELTIPKQPKQVQVDSRTLVAKMTFAPTEQPTIDAVPIDAPKGGQG